MSCSITTSAAPISSRSRRSTGASASTSRWAMPDDGSSSRITVGRWATWQARSSDPTRAGRQLADERRAEGGRGPSAPSAPRRASLVRSSSSNTIGRRSAAASALRLPTHRSVATSSVSSTVISGNSRASWKLRPSPAAARADGLADVMSCPASTIRPASTGMNPDTRSNIVVLPAPFGPMTPTISRSWTSNVTPSTARMPPKRRVSSSTAQGDGCVDRRSSARACRRPARPTPAEEHRPQQVRPLEQLGGRPAEADRRRAP